MKLNQGAAQVLPRIHALADEIARRGVTFRHDEPPRFGLAWWRLRLGGKLQPTTAGAVETGNVVRLTNALIALAIEQDCKAFRVSQNGARVQVALHQNGTTFEAANLPRFVWRPLLARVQTMASLRPGQQRDGSTSVRYKDRDYRLLVSVVLGSKKNAVSVQVNATAAH